VNEVFKQFRDKAQFVFVYIREAHPTDGWQVGDNQRDGILDRQPQSLEERGQVCLLAAERLKLGMLTVVDGMDNKTDADYGAWPERLYVVDKQGLIAYKGQPGPGGFNPRELAESLARFLARPDQQLTSPPAP
jgi:hypothetical protein